MSKSCWDVVRPEFYSLLTHVLRVLLTFFPVPDWRVVQLLTFFMHPLRLWGGSEVFAQLEATAANFDQRPSPSTETLQGTVFRGATQPGEGGVFAH